MGEKTRVVHMREEKYDVYIGRAGQGQDGYFGNPFTRFGYGDSAIPRFEAWFHNRLRDDSEFRERVHGLKGKILGCFCAPWPCHGDIIAKYLDEEV